MNKKKVQVEKKPVQVQASPTLEVVAGNTAVLTVRFLSAINNQLARITQLLEKKIG